MPFIGNKPSAVPLTSADITDGIITSAKIADGTIVNGDINSTAGVVFTKLASTGTITLDNIQFPATAVPSANANNLDDYEEGTWTPVTTNSGFTVNITTLTGVYTKIGRTVTMQMVVNLASSGRPTSYSHFNLPFSTGADSFAGCFVGSNSALGIQGGSVTITGGNLFWYATNGSTDSTAWLASGTYFV